MTGSSGKQLEAPGGLFHLYLGSREREEEQCEALVS